MSDFLTLYEFECEHEWYWIDKAGAEYCYRCRQFSINTKKTNEIMTTEQKRETLLKRFGNKFYNELGERVTNGQKMQGRKPRTLDSNALKLAAQATDAIYKEWIEDCVHEYAEGVCSKCKGTEPVIN